MFNKLFYLNLVNYFVFDFVLVLIIFEFSFCYLNLNIDNYLTVILNNFINLNFINQNHFYFKSKNFYFNFHQFQFNNLKIFFKFLNLKKIH